MKKIRILLFIFVLMMIINSGVNAKGNEISPSIDIIRQQTTMKKCSIVGKEVFFTEDDFSEVIGNDFTYLTVTELPDKKDGVLTLSGVALMEGQTVSAKNLDNLKFIPADKQIVNVSANADESQIIPKIAKKVSFSFVPSASGWENTNVNCEISILPSINFAPVASDMVVRTSSGVESVSAISAYDPDSDEMTVTVSKYPKNGKVKIDSGNRVIYTPDEGFSGTDGFVFYVTDEYGNRSTDANAVVEVSSEDIVFEDMKDDINHYAAIKMSEDNVMTYAEKAGKYYFLPDEEVDRIDFTVMVICAASLDHDVKWINDTAFIDDDGLSSGRKAYLALAQSLDVVTNTNGFFDPYSGIRRCDAAEMVKRALKIDEVKLNGIVPSASSEKILTRSDAAEILYNIKQYTKKD